MVYLSTIGMTKPSVSFPEQRAIYEHIDQLAAGQNEYSIISKAVNLYQQSKLQKWSLDQFKIELSKYINDGEHPLIKPIVEANLNKPFIRTVYVSCV
jgi:hypothetical protein